MVAACNNSCWRRVETLKKIKSANSERTRMCPAFGRIFLKVLGRGEVIVGAAPNVQAGTALDLQHGLFQNVTATKGGGARVSTTIYAHRALRSLLVFELAAEFAARHARLGATVAELMEKIFIMQIDDGEELWSVVNARLPPLLAT